jgi:hypothetical protein
MLPSFDEFPRESLANGFDGVRERAWPANAVVATHSHPFAVNGPESRCLARDLGLAVVINRPLSRARCSVARKD